MVLDKVGISGASGLLGRHCATLFRQHSSTVQLCSRRAPHRSLRELPWQSSDLKDWREASDIEAVFSGCSAVLHAAAQIPGSAATGKGISYDLDVASSRALASWALANDVAVIFFSGAIVYEDVCAQDISESAVCGRNDLGQAYGESKIEIEAIFREAQKRGLRLSILRPSSIYGAGQSQDKLIPYLLGKAHRGEEISLRPPVRDEVNLIHASDVAQAALLALRHEQWGTYNLAFSKSYSFFEIAETCISEAGSGELQLAEEEEGAILTRFDLDCSAAKKAFGFAPSVALAEGISRVAEDYCF